MNIFKILVRLRDDIITWCSKNFARKLNKNLGADKAHKVLVTDDNGEITTSDNIQEYAKTSDLTNGTIVPKKAIEAQTATTATNVASLTNNDSNSNANVKFSIGNKSFSKTINNVTNAVKATNDSNGNPIHTTYATNSELTEETKRATKAEEANAQSIKANADEIKKLKENGIEGVMPIEKGGTNASTESDARTNLGLDTAYSACSGYDISKGTIEQRLTYLGFKEGTAKVWGSGANAIYNELYKQGNIVYGELYIDYTGMTGGYYQSTFDYDPIATLPDGWFVQSENESYRVAATILTQDNNIEESLALITIKNVGISTQVQLRLDGKRFRTIYIHLGYKCM